MHTAPRVLLLGVLILAAGCDFSSSADRSADLNPAADFRLFGSVFVSDPSQPPDGERGPDELGIVAVRVDVFQNNQLVASTLTDSTGRYEFVLPRTPNGATQSFFVRVTDDPSPRAFNPTLLAFYAFAQGGPPAREVNDATDEAEVNFGFAPQRQAILNALADGGDFETGGDSVAVWRQRVIDARANQNCSICYQEMLGYLNAIFSSGNGDPFFGNADPFILLSRRTRGGNQTADPFLTAIGILTPSSGLSADQLTAELFAAELNYLSGRGSGDDDFDRTLLYYLEEAVDLQAVTPPPAAPTPPFTPFITSNAVLGDVTDVLLARAFNRGGGGGGPVGEN